MAVGTTESGGPGPGVATTESSVKPDFGGAGSALKIDAGATLSGPRIDFGAVKATAEAGNRVDALKLIASNPTGGLENNQQGAADTSSTVSSPEEPTVVQQADAPLVEATEPGVVGEATQATKDAVAAQTSQENLKDNPFVAAQDRADATLANAHGTDGTQKVEVPAPRDPATDGRPTAEQVVPTQDAGGDIAEQDARNARKRDLEARNPRDLSVDEIRELNTLRQDPETRRNERLAELESKWAKGELTDPKEQTELAQLYGNEAENIQSNPEDRMDTLQRRVNELDNDLMQKLAEGNMSPEDIVKLTDEMQQLQAEFDGIKNGFSPEDARSMVQEIISKQSKGRERKIAAAEKVQADIQKLMQLELEMLKLPKRGDQLKEEQAKAKKDAAAAHAESKRHKRGTQEHMQAYQEELNALSRLNNINVQVVQLKTDAWMLRAEQHNIESRVRLKTGVTGGLSGFLERAGGMADLALTTIGSLTVDTVKYDFSAY